MKNIIEIPKFIKIFKSYKYNLVLDLYLKQFESL